MLVGETKIELIDVKTGEREEYIDHNMFTNAIDELFNKCPYYFNNVLLSTTTQRNVTEALLTPIFKNAIGGAILLPEQMTEDASNIYAPASNKPTGIASNDAYSGDDARRGSFDEIESGRVTNGYKFVWNFSETRANGKIGCVGLTTASGGKGYMEGEDVFLMKNKYSSPSGSEYELSGIVKTKSSNYSAGDTDDMPQGYCIGASDDGIYFIRNKNRMIMRYTVPTNALDLYSDSNAYEELFVCDANGALCMVGNDIWRVKTAGNSSGNASIQIDKYSSADNWSKTTEIIVVSANLRSTNAWGLNVAVNNGFLYMNSYDQKKVVKINLTSHDATEIEAPFYARIFSFGNGVASKNYIIDENDVVHPITCNGVPVSLNGVWAVMDSENTNYQVAFSVNIFTPMLCTINNLRNVVTKTADKTLKLTYTVTQRSARRV